MWFWFAVTVAAALVCQTASYAQEPRAVDMTRVIVDQDGHPAPDMTAKDLLPKGQEDPDPACARCPRMTLGRAVANALFAVFPDDQDQEQKWARAALAMRIKNEPRAQLTAEEVAVIKKRLGKAFGGLVLVQAFPLLDPNAVPPSVK